MQAYRIFILFCEYKNKSDLRWLTNFMSGKSIGIRSELIELIYFGFFPK